MIRSGPQPPTRQHAATAVGVGLLLAGWTIVATQQPTVLVPTPNETIDRLGELAAGPLWAELGRTVLRSLLGAGAAVLAGVTVGLTTGSSPIAAAMLRPTRALLSGLPPIITVVLLSLWLGIDGDVAPWVVALATMPLTWIATAEAVRAIDPDHIEMALGLRVSRWWRLTRLMLPAIRPPVTAASVYIASTSIRLTIMAELLSGSDGIGARIARARTTLDTPEVFAWALIAVILALVFEALAVRVSPRTRRRLPSTLT
ncbi:MAG: ABC transporter permease subunit [Actinomycetota bacterium]